MNARLPVSHFLLTLAVVAVWGTNFVVIHLGLTHFRPLFFAALRFVFVGFPWLWFFPRPKVRWRSLAAYGFFIGVGQFGLLYVAMRHDISAGLASTVIQMQAFFSVGLAAWFLGEPIRGFQIVALAIAGAGLALIAVNGHQSATPLGLFLTILAAISWSASNMVVKRAGRVNALAFVVWAGPFSVPPLLALSLYFEGWSSIVESLRAADSAAWATVLWQSLANSLFGYGIWSWLLARHPAATITPMAMLVPIFGLGAASLLLGEPLPAWKIAAVVLVMTGLALNVLWPQLRSNRQPIGP